MKVSISQLYAALQKATETLRSTAGDDHFISKQDVLLKLATLEGAERVAIESLYTFLLSQESNKRGRVTLSDLDRAIPLMEEKILPQFRLLPGQLAEETRLALESLGQPSIDLAAALKEYASENVIPAPVDLAKTLEDLAGSLEPVGYHCGSYKPFKSVCLPGSIDTLSAESFVEVVSKYYIDFNHTIERFTPANRDFFLGFTEQQQPQNKSKAMELVNCMQSFLQDPCVVILSSGQSDWHPTYIVGLLNGNLVGIRTSSLWPKNV